MRFLGLFRPVGTEKEEATGTAPFVAHVHKYLQDQIVLADAKAGVISGLAGGLFVAYREVTSDWRITATLDLASFLRAFVQLPFLLAVLMAVVHGYIVLSPRMPDRYRRAAFGVEPLHRMLEWVSRRFAAPLDLDGGGSLVRWPDLADRQIYPSSADYASKVLAQAEVELTRNLAEHGAVLARIAAEKHQHVRLSVNYLVTAGVLVAILSMLGQLGRQ